MKLQSLIIDLLLLTAVIGMYNGFGLIGGNSYDPKYNVSQASVNGITQIDGTEAVQEKGFLESLLPGGVYWVMKSVEFVFSLIWIVIGMGNIIPQYIPGPVGLAFQLIINALMLFVVGWSAVQLWGKVSTKYMD